jgi:hypothetical protein
MLLLDLGAYLDTLLVDMLTDLGIDIRFSSATVRDGAEMPLKAHDGRLGEEAFR